MKRKYLKPITAVAITILSNLTGTVSASDLSVKESSSIESELLRIKNYREGISKEQFLRPVDQVLLAEVTPNLDGATFYHTSHYSHRSHGSHRSHYSSYY